MLDEEIILPKSDLNIARSHMPQITQANMPDFLKSLKKQGIRYKEKKVAVAEIKPSQGEFNIEKIKGMLHKAPKTEFPILMSKDKYILDGHHRYATELNRNPRYQMAVLEVDLSILDLLRVARNYDKVIVRSIAEEVKNIIFNRN